MTHTPWTAERAVDLQLARTLIRSQFPALALETIAPFGSGWDNSAFLVDDTWVFRFPRREVAVALLDTEARVLPALAPHLSLPIPIPSLIGKPSDLFPWPFTAYRLLAGRTACGARLTLDEREQAAPILGKFLRELHDVHLDVELPHDTIARTDITKRLPDLRARLDVLRERGLADPAPLLGLLDGGIPPATMQPKPVHGDLYARHLLVDEMRALSGVIDWGDVHRGDPGVDLAIRWLLLPPAARRAFDLAYGAIDERTLRLSRLRALVHAVATTWFGESISDRDLIDEGVLALGFILQE
jgi:aminoglycoside phosphotransferase (APT) family kinase protein